MIVKKTPQIQIQLQSFSYTPFPLSTVRTLPAAGHVLGARRGDHLPVPSLLLLQPPPRLLLLQFKQSKGAAANGPTYQRCPLEYVTLSQTAMA